MNAAKNSLSAGSLRHRIAFDRQDTLQDPTTGEVSTVWTQVASDVPAAVTPLSGREYMLAAQLKSAITARITVRYRADLNTAMQVRHGGNTYRIQAILPDNGSGKEWLTLLVESK